jgi:hypothetical protein
MQRKAPIIPSQHAHATAALWLWLALGVAALLLFPDLRGSDPRFGWLPFWFIVAPLIDLAILRRRWLMAASRAWLVRARHWHRPAHQARRLQRRRASRHSPRPLRAA